MLLSGTIPSAGLISRARKWLFCFLQLLFTLSRFQDVGGFLFNRGGVCNVHRVGPRPNDFLHLLTRPCWGSFHVVVGSSCGSGWDSMFVWIFSSFLGCFLDASSLLFVMCIFLLSCYVECFICNRFKCDLYAARTTFCILFLVCTGESSKWSYHFIPKSNSFWQQILSGLTVTRVNSKKTHIFLMAKDLSNSKRQVSARPYPKGLSSIPWQSTIPGLFLTLWIYGFLLLISCFLLMCHSHCPRQVVSTKWIHQQGTRQPNLHAIAAAIYQCTSPPSYPHLGVLFRIPPSHFAVSPKFWTTLEKASIPPLTLHPPKEC